MAYTQSTKSLHVKVTLRNTKRSGVRIEKRGEGR
jgi:hypothetical protein